MATLALRSFTRMEMLKSVDPIRLVQFLNPYASFLADRHVVLPSVTSQSRTSTIRDEIDFDGIIRIFASPDTPHPIAPSELIDDACIIDEMSTDHGMDTLLTEADLRKIDLGKPDDQAPMDVAVHAWLLDSELVQHAHAQQYLDRPRSFEYFPRLGSVRRDPAKTTPAVLKRMETDLDNWFEKRRRGRGSHIYVFKRPDSTWFLIRHGQPLRREGSLDNGEPSSVMYRPERFDVVAYDHSLDELRMNAQSKGEKDLYRQVFGKHLFDEPMYFGSAAKYTLDPIRVQGRACLNCDDIAGIDSIKLVEVQFYWGGAENETEIHKASDVYAAYEAREKDMPLRPKVTKARFEVKFKDSRSTRRVAVNGNSTQCVRDADTAYIETWLEARGFASQRDTKANASEPVPKVLVDDEHVAELASKLRGVGVEART